MQLDHLGFLVTDLARVAARARRSGFDLSDPVDLTDAEGRPTGGTQQVTVFDEGYLEFQELTELGRGHVLERLVTRAPVVAVLAYACDDLDDEVARLRAAGLAMTDPVVWSRRTAAGRARFRFSAVDDDRGPVRVLTHHLTPELVHRPGRHRNGVMSLAGVARGVDVPRRAWTSPEAARLELEDHRDVSRLVLRFETSPGVGEEGSWTVKDDRMRTVEDLGIDLRWMSA